MARTDPVPDDLITINELADLFKTSPGAIYAMRARGAKGEGPLPPPAYKVGKRLLFSKTQALKWLAGREATYRQRPRRRGPVTEDEKAAVAEAARKKAAKDRATATSQVTRAEQARARTRTA